MHNPIRYTIDRVYEHRARWAARRILPFLKENDTVIDIGAGDCRVDEILQRRGKVVVTPVDVEDFNRSSLKVLLFDGKHLPFPDDHFDVALFLFVLHHAEDVEAVLAEARRVTRRAVIVFEDLNKNWWDRFTFRMFHKWLKVSEKIEYPFREWTPDQWTVLANKVGLKEQSRQPLGRDIGIIASRHLAFEWVK